jgi:hypothetical protein
MTPAAVVKERDSGHCGRARREAGVGARQEHGRGIWSGRKIARRTASPNLASRRGRRRGGKRAGIFTSLLEYCFDAFFFFLPKENEFGEAIGVALTTLTHTLHWTHVGQRQGIIYRDMRRC